MHPSRVDTHSILSRQTSNDSIVIVNKRSAASRQEQAIAHILFEAAIKNEPSQIRAVMTRGVHQFNINETRRALSGMTPVHVAARHGSFEALEQLIIHGARVHVKCSSAVYHMNPLHLAVYFSQDVSDRWYNYQKIIELLLTLPIAGSMDANGVDGLNRTPLHWAALRGFGKAIKLLLEKGACRDVVDYYGWSPLHYAIEFNLLGGGGFDFYKSLICPDNVNLKNQDGQTVLHIAADQHRGKTRKKLSGRQHSIVFNSYTIGRLEMVKTLLVNGADKSIKDKFNMRPADLAISPAIINELACDPTEALSMRRAAKESEYRKYGAAVFHNWQNHIETKKKTETDHHLPRHSDLPHGLVDNSQRDVAKMSESNVDEMERMIDEMRKQFHSDQVHVLDKSSSLELRTKDALMSLLQKTQQISRRTNNFTDTEWFAGMPLESLQFTCELIDYVCKRRVK